MFRSRFFNFVNSSGAPKGRRGLEARIMDIIGRRFQEVMYQQKSTWRELVIFTEREFIVVSVSLLSGEIVPTDKNNHLNFLNLKQ